VFSFGFARRLAVVVLAVGIVGVFALAAAAASELDGAEESVPSSLPPGVVASDLPLAGGQGAEQLEEEAQKARTAEEQREAELASPAMVEERELSQTEYVGVSDGAAEDLALDEFGSLLRGSLSGLGLEAMADGRPVERIVDDHTAILGATGDKPAVLLESGVPLRALADDGEKAPVDLSLEQTADGYEPANSVVDVSLPAELSDGIDVGPVGFDMAGSSEGEPSGEGGGDDWMFYANSEVDTDVAITPLVNGAEVFWQLRSPRAAEELTLDVDVPEGALLAPTDDGGAVVTRDGQRLTVVQPPMAVDAQGQDVPARLEVVGDGLVVSVAHRNADLAYPILVDPVIQNNWTAGSWYDQDPDSLADLADWFVSYDGVGAGAYIQTLGCYLDPCDAAARTGYDPELPDGLHIYVRTLTTYPASWAEWAYDTPGTSTQIVDSGLQAWYHRRGASQNPYMFTGIWSSGANSWVGTPGAYYQDMAGQTVTHAGGGSVAGPQYLTFGFKTPTSVNHGPWKDGYIGAASIALSDPEAPAIASPQLYRLEPNATPGQPAVWTARTSRWVKEGDDLAIRANTTDPGLGIKNLQLQGPGISDAIDPGCIGNNDVPCPGNIPATEGSQFNFTLGSATPEGDNTATITALDPIGHTTSVGTSVKVDNTRPVVPDPTGSLWANREITAGSGLPALAPGTYPINVTASDPNMSTNTAKPGSGIEKIEVKVDGYTEKSTTCGGGGGGCSTSWTYDTSEFSGRHRIDVVATDLAGNTNARKSFVVNGPARGDLVYPVDGEVTSSKVALQAKANETASGVQFQYRRTDFGAWTTIATNLTDDRGALANQATHLLSEPNNKTKKLIWDIRAHLSTLVPKPSQVQVRALFTTATGDFKSSVANIQVDEKGLSAGNAQESAGPGSVDLLTGNLSLSATDASLPSFGESITLTRTYNSLDPDANPNGPFGPGWVTSAPVEGVSDYSSLTVLTDPTVDGWVDLTDSAGAKIRFERTDDTKFEPEPGFEDLTLVRVPDTDPSQTLRYTLTDLDGVVTTFVKLATTKKFVPTKVERPDSNGVLGAQGPPATRMRPTLASRDSSASSPHPRPEPTATRRPSPPAAGRSSSSTAPSREWRRAA